MSWPKLTGGISARYRPVAKVPRIGYPSGTRIRGPGTTSTRSGRLSDAMYTMAKFDIAALQKA